VAVIVGSSTCHLAQSKTGVFGSGAAGCYPDATVEGLYTLEAGQTATGSILDWYRRHLAGREQAEALSRGVNVYEVLDEQAAATPPGADGLVVRDDWQGNRSPYMNPQARGAIAGLSLAHGPGHIFRALYEATAVRHPPHP
jgi:ribulose kinase